MKRRKFIKSVSMLAGGMTLSYSWAGSNLTATDSVRFGISADIHNDIIHDGEKRLKKYLDKMSKSKVDFIIDMGDFCHPVNENKAFLDIWESSSLTKYNMMGNHDMDLGDKRDFMEFVGLKKRYYSYDQEGFHFVVLDPNNLYIDGKYIPYANANFYIPAEQRAHVDPEQLDWLRKDLEATDLPCVVFSHQSLENPSACQNQVEVRAILEEANEKSSNQKVIAAFSGHDHTDYVKTINKIHYIQINSMSYVWVGDKYEFPDRFSESINKKRPQIKNTVPFTDPLYAVINIGKGKIHIKGVKSSFIEPGPKELGMDLSKRQNPLVPFISNSELSI